MAYRTVVVPESLAGERVDRIVAIESGLSRSEIDSLALLVNGRAVKRSHRVEIGDVVEFDEPAPADASLVPDETVPFDVVTADDSVIVVDKPAGVVVHPAAGVRSSTLVHGLLARYPDLVEHEWADPLRPGIVHRLDKDTSGLLMVARTPAAYDILRAQLEARSVDRRYLALVVGGLEHDAGTIDAPVGRSTRDRTRMAVAAAGRDARTNYSVVERFNDATLVECKLETGRTHQIRVHLAAIGHPVVGDNRYRGARLHGIRRPFLHAHRLGFDHPDGAARQYESALPPELDAVMKAARAAT